MINHKEMIQGNNDPINQACMKALFKLKEIPTESSLYLLQLVRYAAERKNDWYLLDKLGDLLRLKPKTLMRWLTEDEEITEIDPSLASEPEKLMEQAMDAVNDLLSKLIPNYLQY